MVNGQEIPAEQLSEMKLTFSYSTFEAIDGDRKSSGKIKNENRESPMRLTFTIDKGDDVGRELKAIYERAGKELKIAISRSGEFPTEFSSSDSNQYALMTYTMVKKVRATTGRKKRPGLELLRSGDSSGS